MFRWKLMLQNCFGSHREQAKDRRPKETVKPRLEILEDRTLLSGSPLPVEYAASPPPVPPIAAVQSYVNSTLNHWAQVVAMVQQVFVGYYQGVTQEISQLESTAGLEVDHLLGINPNPPTQSTNPVVVPPGSGMGRGNSVASGRGVNSPTTRPVPTQPSNNSAQLFGNGSGGSNTPKPTHGGSSVNVLHPMTGSGSGGSGSGSGFLPKVYFGSGSYSVPENGSGSGADLEVELSAPVNKTVTVNYQTANGTATAGTDYTAVSGTLTFQPNVTSQYIQVPILDDGPGDDNLVSESFTASLSGPTNATLGTPSTTTVSIMEQATVSGQVWLDNDGDGSLDNNELDYSGDVVSLYTCDQYGNNPSLLMTMLTNSNRTGNNFQFVVPASKLPGYFEVGVGIPQYFTATYKGADSEIDINSGFTSVFRLSPELTDHVIAGLLSMTVSTTSDDPLLPLQNSVTLRDAIKTGNNGGGPFHLSKVDFVKTGTIALEEVLDKITRSYNIVGPGSANLTVQGNGGALDPYSIFTIGGGVTTTISGLTITGGYGNSFGGGIANYGSLTLDTDIIKGNQAGSGGGISNSPTSTLIVKSTDITGNTANGAAGMGGGIYNGGILRTYESTQISGTNSAKMGGGIANVGSSAEADISVYTTIANNKASQGGGVYNSVGKFTIPLNEDTQAGSISGNSATEGGGLYVVSGTVVITSSASPQLFVIGNNKAALAGGGAYIAGGTVTISGGSIKSNTANNGNFDGNGGGLYTKGGTLTLKYEVIGPKNTAEVSGGGAYLAAGSTTNFDNVTVGGNILGDGGGQGKGIAYQMGATMNPQPLDPPALTDNDDKDGKPVQV